jgi:hypothetical protein
MQRYREFSLIDGSGTAQEAAQKKMGLKFRQNRIEQNDFFLPRFVSDVG